MKLLVVTPVQPIENEAHLIERMLDAGVARVHIRHPHLLPDFTRRLLDDIAPQYHNMLSLHDHHELAQEYATGVHLNRRNPLPPDGFNGVLSCSFHSLSEVDSRNLHYYFLSPIFPSISKPGYTPTLTHDAIHEAFLNGTLDRKAVALGGVTPERLPLLRDMGFNAASMLGYAWEGSTEEIIKRISTLCCNL